MYGEFEGKGITVDVITEAVGNTGTVCQRIVNNKSGEILSTKFIKESDKPAGRQPKTKQPHFYKLYRTNWQEVVKKKHLTPYEVGVFFMLLSFVGWESNFLIHPKTGANLNCSQLSILTGIDRSTLTNTLDKLNRKGFIAVVKCGDGNSNHYLLNSNLVFWGSQIKDVSEHSRFIKDCPYKPTVELKYKERLT